MGAELIAGISAVSGLLGAGAAIANKPKTPKMMPIDNREVKTNDDAALRNAQDMARKRRGYAANILNDGSSLASSNISAKNLLGQ